MADSLSLSDFPDNKDRDGFDQWLEARSDRFADLIAKEIKRITTNAYEAFVKSVDETAVTASGDINSIDSVIPEWNLVVEGPIMDEINQTYLTGSVSAYTTASQANMIPPQFASKWAQVVNQQAVEYALQANNRIRDVGKTLWNDMRKRVSKTIATGSTTEQLKTDIEALTNFSEYRADTIARTEIASAYINGNYQGDLAMGQYGPVEKVWVASGDARTRPTHVSAMAESEANPVPFSEPFNVGGVEMMYPHSAGAPAKEVVNCRCHYESYYIGDTRPDGTIVQDPNRREIPQQTFAYQGATMSPEDFDGQFIDILEMGGGVQGDLSPQGDLHLAELWRRQGFDARPKTVSPKQLQELINEQGWTELHRGISGSTPEEVDQFVSQFVTGANPYAGKGMFGNGTYASKSTTTADAFTKQTARGEATEFGKRLDMALHPDAKIIDYGDLWDLHRKIADEERVARNALYDAVEGSDDMSWSEVVAQAPPEMVSAYREIETKRYLLEEKPSNLATVYGYDAVRIVNPHVNAMSDEVVDDVYFVILNRGALVVGEP